MFINEKILKRLMLRSFKGNGLYMANYDGYYYLSDAFSWVWEARIAVGCVPRAILGVMVECAGDLPREGEGWTSDKEKNQTEAFKKWGMPEPENGKYPLVRETPVLIMSMGGTPYRVLQLPGNEAISARLDLLSAINQGGVDRDNGEEMISGPFFDGEGGIFAFTNHAAWHISARNPQMTEDIMESLSVEALRYDEP